MLRRSGTAPRLCATQERPGGRRREEHGVEPVRVALLGCGVVGSEVARNLTTHGAELAQRVGAPLELAGIAVRRLGRARELDLDPDLFTTDAAGLVKDVDVVVEVIGGIEPARPPPLQALAGGGGGGAPQKGPPPRGRPPPLQGAPPPR